MGACMAQRTQAPPCQDTRTRATHTTNTTSTRTQTPSTHDCALAHTCTRARAHTQRTPRCSWSCCQAAQRATATAALRCCSCTSTQQRCARVCVGAHERAWARHLPCMHAARQCVAAVARCCGRLAPPVAAADAACVCPGARRALWHAPQARAFQDGLALNPADKLLRQGFWWVRSAPRACCLCTPRRAGAPPALAPAAASCAADSRRPQVKCGGRRCCCC
jgi:hypothetical protein